MKLIATKDFANVPALNLKLEKFKKDAAGNDAMGHVHKGARFALGTTEKYEQMAKSDPNRLLIAQLFVTGSAAAADPETCKRIDAEIAADEARAARDAKAAGVPLTLDTLVTALKALSPKAA